MDDDRQAGRSELIFGLVGAVGTNLKAIEAALISELARVGYSAETIRLTDCLCSFAARFRPLASLTMEDERIGKLMDAGDEFRESALRSDAMSLLAISEVQKIRERQAGDPEKKVPNTAYIIHSLKHPDEIQTLRSVFSSEFFVVSVYSPKASRTEALQVRIAKSRGSYRNEMFHDVAETLIARDLKEIGTTFGQDVEATFPKADFFIDARPSAEIDKQVKRFVEILFNNPFITPTVDEFGMFHAKAASLRTADLSRQVGAVISTDNGELISSGCNEVPIAGGGANWEKVVGTDADYRDFRIGHDSTARMKHELISEIFERLKDWFNPSLSGLNAGALASKALFDGTRPLLKGTRVDSLLEFGRIVHAEMAAITEAARRGHSVNRARLYCTTFPCHVCARHIIASGIHEVIYIEPYPKSMAKDLYKKSIRVDDDQDADEDAVVFRPFFGVAPRKFIEFFEAGSRKDHAGHAIRWVPQQASPRVGVTTDGTALELGLIQVLGNILNFDVPRDLVLHEGQ